MITLGMVLGFALFAGGVFCGWLFIPQPKFVSDWWRGV